MLNDETLFSYFTTLIGKVAAFQHDPAKPFLISLDDYFEDSTKLGFKQRPGLLLNMEDGFTSGDSIESLYDRFTVQFAVLKYVQKEKSAERRAVYATCQKAANTLFQIMLQDKQNYHPIMKALQPASRQLKKIDFPAEGHFGWETTVLLDYRLPSSPDPNDLNP